jgi:hypothetical protein
LVWAKQAEFIKETGDIGEGALTNVAGTNVAGTNVARTNVAGTIVQINAITQTYARIMHAACLRSQELALTTGTLLPEHEELADIINTTSDRLASRTTAVGTQPRAVALMAQGFTTTYKANLLNRLAKPNHAKKAANLEALLATLSEIERCAVVLSGPNPPSLPLDRKISMAKTAVSNARYSLSLLFSKQLSDWAMAQFYCKHAYSLLTSRQIPDADKHALPSRPDDGAPKDLPAAYDALKRRNYKESNEHLNAVLKQLDEIAQS